MIYYSEHLLFVFAVLIAVSTLTTTAATPVTEILEDIDSERLIHPIDTSPSDFIEEISSKLSVINSLLVGMTTR